MGILLRGKRYYIRIKGPDGWVTKRTPYVEGQAREAQQLYERAVALVQKGESYADAVTGETTVASFARRWLQEREERGVVGVRNERIHLVRHVVPVLGAMKLADVRPRAIRDLFRALPKKARAPKSLAEKRGEVEVTERLSSRTVRHVYGTLHAMFRDAVAEELILANPCVLKRGELPQKKDKDPSFRRRAVFTRGEIEVLISDERIPFDRRVVYAMSFLAGLRPGELVALEWRDYDRSAEPLGRLTIAKAYKRNIRTVRETKTGTDREIPVHPTLARVLARWRLEGFASYFGRAPRDDDRIIPSRSGPGVIRSVWNAYDRFQEDLRRAGLRERRFYDTRRTFISLARGGGASKEVLRWVTHGVRRDILDEYTTLPWETLCAAVLCLKAELLEGRVLELRRAAGAVTALVTSETTSGDFTKEIIAMEHQKELGPAGLEPSATCPKEQGEHGSADENSRASVRSCSGRSGKKRGKTTRTCDGCDEYRPPRVASASGEAAGRMAARALRRGRS